MKLDIEGLGEQGETSDGAWLGLREESLSEGISSNALFKEVKTFSIGLLEYLVIKNKGQQKIHILDQFIPSTTSGGASFTDIEWLLEGRGDAMWRDW